MGEHHTKRIALLGILVTGALAVADAHPVAADPRRDQTVTWLAPSVPGTAAPVAGYEIRISSNPVGSDAAAWWSAAAPVSGAPSPLAAGSRQVWTLRDLPLGTTSFAAVKSVSAAGVWSAPSNVLWLGTARNPLLTAATPTEVSSGAATLHLSGVGLDDATGVRLHFSSGEAAANASSTLLSGGLLHATFTVPASASGPVDIELLTPWGSDLLRGWLQVAPDPTLPPTTVTNLDADALASEVVRLSWSAPGDPAAGGYDAAQIYEIRRLAGSPGAWTWTGGTVVPAPTPGAYGSPQMTVVDGLVPGTEVAFALRSRDDDGIWSEISNVATVILPIPVDPPAVVADLSATALDPQTVELTWTAPAAGEGASATAYDLRRLAGSDATGWEWETGVAIGAPGPAAPGAAERVVVSGLAPGSRVAFAITSMITGSDWADLSNVATVTLPVPPDTIPPDPITDLVASEGDAGWFLVWTAPADEGLTITRYELRCGDPEAFVWETATVVAPAPSPADPGTAQYHAVVVESGGCAAFALVAYDGSGNRSAVSNLAAVDRRGDDITPPARPWDFELSRYRTLTAQLRWRAPGDDGMTGRADHYVLRVIAVPDVETDWWKSGENVVLEMSPKLPGKRERTNVCVPDGNLVYGFALCAVDDAGLESEWVFDMIHIDGVSAEVDASPPSAPAGVTAVAETGGVRISWLPAPDPDLAGYRVVRIQGDRTTATTVAEVGAEVLAFLDRVTVEPGMSYAVVSRDAMGNESPSAAQVEVTGGPGLGETVVPDGGGWALTLPAASVDGARAVSVPPDAGVYDVRGRRLAAVAPYRNGDAWTVRWDGRLDSGLRAPRGIYFLRVRGAAAAVTRKVLVSR